MCNFVALIGDGLFLFLLGERERERLTDLAFLSTKLKCIIASHYANFKAGKAYLKHFWRGK